MKLTVALAAAAIIVGTMQPLVEGPGGGGADGPQHFAVPSTTPPLAIGPGGGGADGPQHYC